MFGSKIHMICSTDPSTSAISLSANVTTANVSDKSVYSDIVSCISPEILKKINFMVADLGFSGKKLYDLFERRTSVYLSC